MMLLETKKNLNQTCARSAYEFSVEKQKAQKKRQTGVEMPLATIPDFVRGLFIQRRVSHRVSHVSPRAM